ncbi:hypothetical protein MKEN_00965200 [Mycena kentingensis (nom. inval.)]|nr:hypothetical protein MKEN_00965200 [Mycena kentingensis (nom. inval.)]
MSVNEASFLTSSEKDMLIALRNKVRDARFDNRAEHDKFLVESASSVLEFQDKAECFADIKDAADCVFTIRANMLKHNFRTNGPSGAVFSEILGFAQEIARVRKLHRERKKATEARKRGAEAAAQRRERLDALAYAAAKEKAKNAARAASPSSEDTISLGSPAPETASPINPDPVLLAPTQALSPLDGLIKLMSLAALNPPAPPSPVSPSMPALIPATPSSSPSPSPPAREPTGFRTSNATRQSARGRKLRRSPILRGQPVFRPLSMLYAPQMPIRNLGPLSLSVRRPIVADDYRQPKPSYADVLRGLTHTSIASPANANALAGNSMSSSKQRRLRGKVAKLRNATVPVANPAIKRCFYCDSPSHTIRFCPAATIY